MKITALIQNSLNINNVKVKTNNVEKTLSISSKTGGYGSGINGGELLFLSLAVCFCNDIYREAVKRKIMISGVDVKVNGDFAAEGEPASNISYSVKIKSDASEKEINELIKTTDKLAEIHNTLRKGAKVELITE